MREFEIFFVKDFGFNDKNEKIYDGHVIGKVELPVTPATIGAVQMRKRHKKKKEEDFRDNYVPPTKIEIQKYCEDNNITLEQYKKIEEQQKKRSEQIKDLGTGYLNFKNKKYMIDSIESSKDGSLRLNVLRS